MMKGQLVFEFVIATLFFLVIVIYTITYLNTTVFAFSDNHYSSMLENNAWQVSEVLVTREGVWTGTAPNMNPEELGLAEDWPVLSEDKIESLNTWCMAPGIEEGLAELLDVNPEIHGTAIEIFENTAAGELNILTCGTQPGRVPHAMITRFGVKDTNGNLLKIMVWYW